MTGLLGGGAGAEAAWGVGVVGEISSMSVSVSAVLSAALGVGVGLGGVLVLAGLRGRQTPDRGEGRRSARPRQRDRVLVLRIAAVVAVAVLTGMVTGWVVGAVLAGVGCWSLPGIVGRDRYQAARVARIEAIASWSEMLRDTLSAAAGLEQAILVTAPLAPRAIRSEITGLAARLQGGVRIDDALRITAGELADHTSDLVCAALMLASRQHARQLGDLLGSLAQAAREQASMRLRVEAGRARSRTSVRVVVGTTLGFAAGLVLLNRPYLAAYDTAAGQLVLLGIGGVFAAGFAWLACIATVAEPARLLIGSPDTADTADTIGNTDNPGRVAAVGS